MKNLKIIVKGKVQGVWFRATTQKIAQELKLSGFVRNEADGDVYIEVTGEEEPIKEFLYWLTEGPEISDVEKLTIEKNEITHLSHFEIK
jgi:acylphosphatase